MGVEYWLEDFERQWGRPRNGCKLVLVTDSQASVDIISNIPQRIGISDMLKPEMDVGLEVYHQQQQKQWVHRRVEKVISHIEIEDALNEFFWACNTVADELATVARTVFSVNELKALEDNVFPGTRVGCKIDGRLENNNLYMLLTEHIQGRALKFFLMEKYGWSYRTFMDIGWIAHQRELSKYPRLQRGTLIKYMHGWLATKLRRRREGSVMDSTCPLCGGEENRQHLFSCPNEQYSSIRKERFRQLLMDISGFTEPGCKQIFHAGLETVFGSPHPEETTKVEWPVILQRAYSAQLDIGWEQVFYGRLSKQWEPVAMTPERDGNHGNLQWSGKVIRLCWKFGLVLWKVRNDCVHGTEGIISKLEEQRVKDVIKLIYSRKFVFGISENWSEFPSDESVVLNWTYDTQVTFIDRLRFLYPEVMKQLEKSNGIQIR